MSDTKIIPELLTLIKEKSITFRYIIYWNIFYAKIHSHATDIFVNKQRKYSIRILFCVGYLISPP